MGRSLRFLSALQLLTAVFCVAAKPNEPHLPRSTTFAAVKEQTYDYVIVGGGLAGLVVANRLSEDPSKSVLVIENGPIDTSPATYIPYMATSLNTADLYNITSAPVAAFANQTYSVTVANVVGGGTIVNGLAWNRGANADYDAWEALGNADWGWAGLGPYFKKSTHYTAPSQSTISEYNITFDASAYGNGPVQVSIPSFQFSDIKPIYQAWHSENVSFPQDGMDTGLGAFWQPNDIDNKTSTRSSALVTYYLPVQSRPNLTLLYGTKVTQILIDNVNGSLLATGVQILSSNSTTSKVYAGKEVILAAGGIFTPHLLMLSGIGPKEVLTAANITVKKDFPAVGANFQDHVPLAMIFNLSNVAFPNPTSIPTNASFNASSAAQYAKDRSGAYSYGRGVAQATLAFKQITAKYANITAQFSNQNATQYLPDRYAKNAALLKGFLKQKEILVDRFLGDDSAITQLPIQAWGHSSVTIQKPLSRGTIELNATHPASPPVVQWNTLMNPVDKAVLGELVRFNRVHWAKKELSGYSPVEIQPGLQHQTDDDIVSASAQMGALTPTFAHLSGGCSMMPEELGGCVSDQLLVYGVAKLSVVDASVLPLIPACNLQATMYAVSEKAADIIKAR